MEESNEERITHLRQFVISLESSDPARAQAIHTLSQLYAVSLDYPSDPALYTWEVCRIGESPFRSGGFGDCWKGLFYLFLGPSFSTRQGLGNDII
ncbi:hypothetical protein BOTBODRAFT_36589 [Botryobasidium botryosum FD-172 SS1]|uniref:Uncharacterized protein n=1 Tax=Botryobasidium botryosum (strain FD-172 SS1) TaxID=930990 RepID=A0A067M5I1_BOTB1|nr:hypothetical protein BOTBODRAFT_36589 [Botryobasidium botryosum FD-172 SS1]